MAMLNRPMVPSFLQKLDNWLLRHHPTIWQTRVHLALWYILLTGIVLSLLCLVSFNDARRDTEIGGWITFTVLISILGLVIWLIYLLRFNVFKRFGQWKPLDALISFVLYFVIAAALGFLNFIPPLVQSFRANQQYSNSEIIKDINEINTTACLLEYDILPLNWTPDTCQLVSKTTITVERETDRPLQQVSNPYTLVDTMELNRRLQINDSVVKLRDDLYVFYSCPDYQFISFFRYSWGSPDLILSSAEIYRKYLKTKPDINRNQLMERMNDLKEKWAVFDNRYVSYSENDYIINSDTYINRIQKKYDLRRVDNGIESVLDKKFRFEWEEGFLWRFLIYPALFIALLLFVFRNSTVRTFFLTLLTIVLLMIFTGLVMIGITNPEETTFLGVLIFYYVLFGGIGLSITSSGKRSAIQGIGLNLFFLMTPFVPLILTAYYTQSRKWVYDDFSYQWPGGLSETELMQIAEITGLVFLLLMLQLLFRKLYRKWYALPEN